MGAHGPGPKVFASGDRAAPGPPQPPKKNWKNILFDIESRENIIFSLNTLIKDPDFYKRVSFEPSHLTEKAQSIKNKSEKEQISSDETLFLNRDILEAALEGTVKNGFVLSDGSRISSSLNPDQLELLIGLYEDELRLKNIPENRKQELSALIDQIYSNDIKSFI